MRGNPHSPNVPPRSDLERIIWKAGAQQRESSSYVVESKNIEEEIKPIPSILLPELKRFSSEEEGKFNTESPQIL